MFGPLPIQQPPPQPVVPAGRAPVSMVQPASHPGGLWLVGNTEQVSPSVVGAVNAHPQPVEPATPQQPRGSPASVVPHWAPAQLLEHLGASVGSGHVGAWAHVLVEPPILQFVFWQQQQHPATAPAPLVTPHASVVKSAHCLFVGVAAAAREGTAIEYSIGAAATAVPIFAERSVISRRVSPLPFPFPLPLSTICRPCDSSSFAPSSDSKALTTVSRGSSSASAMRSMLVSPSQARQTRAACALREWARVFSES